MEKKGFLKKPYKNFNDFIMTSASKELEYYIIDSKFHDEFSKKLKKTIDDVKEIGNDGAGFNVFFNTDGEVALVDAEIIGSFIGNCYQTTMMDYYKNIALNRIVRSVINNGQKAQKDFVKISFLVLYNILGQVYREIKYNKEITEKYIEKYCMEEYEKNDSPIIVASILITEDISRFLSLDSRLLSAVISEEITKRKCRQ